MSPSAEQLLRLVRLIPLASRPEGIAIPDAARICAVDEGQVEADVRLLAERAWYLPPGRTDDFQILIVGDRIRIEAPPAFHRPARLALDELLACALALRCAGLDSERRMELCREIEEALALESDLGGGTAKGRTHPGAPDTEVEVVLRHAASDDIQSDLARGIVLRRRVRFGYVKDGAEAPEVRTVEPWRQIHAAGESYLVGHDVERDAPRLYRVDRILGVEVTETACEVPVREGPEVVLPDGSVQLVGEADEDRWAEVRYSPGVARWVRERWDGVEGEEGDYTVRHRVLTEEWLVRHVLAWGADAELLEPASIRRRVVEVVRG